MKKLASIMMAILLAWSVQTAVAEEAPQQVVEFVNKTLAAFGTDGTLVQAVKAENARGKTMDQIKARDDQWLKTPGVADFMKPVLENETSRYLRGIQEKYKYLAEIFLMDNQGALVAATNKTSDYWQGDEAKFQHPFSKGTVHLSAVEFDTSAQAYLVQASVPVRDGSAVIGAITFGINLDDFK